MSEYLGKLLEQWPDEGSPERPITEHRCEECDETDRLLGGRTWRDVALNFPDYCHDVFPLLTDAAKKYYLPAFMYAAIDKGNCQGISVEQHLASDSFTRDGYSGKQLELIKQWVREALGEASDSESISKIMNKVA